MVYSTPPGLILILVIRWTVTLDSVFTLSSTAEVPVAKTVAILVLSCTCLLYSSFVSLTSCARLVDRLLRLRMLVMGPRNAFFVLRTTSSASLGDAEIIQEGTFTTSVKGSESSCSFRMSSDLGACYMQFDTMHRNEYVYI